jgi:hypothetical protein
VNTILRFIFFSPIIFSVGQHAYAHEFSGVNFDSLARDSELVFRGKTLNVQYAQSAKVGNEHESIPHTFVTFKILEVFKGGNKVNSKLTLRIVGGKRKDGKILDVSSIPLFDLGDDDVLFVKNNGISYCPFSRCKDGRFRIIKGRVYTEDGDILMKGEAGKIEIGTYTKLNEVITHYVGNLKLGILEIRSPVDPEENSQDRDPETYRIYRQKSEAKPLSATGFLDSLRDKRWNKGEKKTIVSSLYPWVRFVSDFGKPNSKPISTGEHVNIQLLIKDMTPKERLEFRALLKNRLNPVLTRKRN